MPFHAPDPVAGQPPAHLQPCDDKQNCDYPEPCSNQWNMVLGFAPHSKTPNTQRVDFRPKRCQDNHGQGQIHEVCRYCIAFTEDEHWFKLAEIYFGGKAPVDVENNGRSRYYLTRLCKLCEWREHQLQVQLQQLVPSVILPPLPPRAERNMMQSWPESTCTCWRQTIVGGVRCRPHRRELWNAVRPRLVRQKDKNRRHLINIELDASGQQIASTQATRIRRIRDELWRACRCGADPVPTVAEAMVMQCMACEGIVHFGTPPPMNPPPAPLLLRQNSMTTPGLFAFP